MPLTLSGIPVTPSALTASAWLAVPGSKIPATIPFVIGHGTDLSAIVAAPTTLTGTAA